MQVVIYILCSFFSYFFSETLLERMSDSVSDIGGGKERRMVGAHEKTQRWKMNGCQVKDGEVGGEKKGIL